MIVKFNIDLKKMTKKYLDTENQNPKFFPIKKVRKINNDKVGKWGWESFNYLFEDYNAISIFHNIKTETDYSHKLYIPKSDIKNIDVRFYFLFVCDEKSFLEFTYECRPLFILKINRFSLRNDFELFLNSCVVKCSEILRNNFYGYDHAFLLNNIKESDYSRQKSNKVVMNSFYGTMANMKTLSASIFIELRDSYLNFKRCNFNYDLYSKLFNRKEELL